MSPTPIDHVFHSVLSRVSNMSIQCPFSIYPTFSIYNLGHLYKKIFVFCDYHTPTLQEVVIGLILTLSMKEMWLSGCQSLVYTIKSNGIVSIRWLMTGITSAPS